MTHLQECNKLTETAPDETQTLDLHYKANYVKYTPIAKGNNK